MSTLIKPRDSEDGHSGNRPALATPVAASARAGGRRRWFFGLWAWAYDLVNTFSADPVRTVHLTNPATLFPWIIQPWTAVIYISAE